MGRRLDLDLEMIGVPVGATLRLELSSGEKVTCIVVQQSSPPQVVYEGEVMTLTGVMDRINYPSPPARWLN